jgi:hypothetical protein
VTVTLSHCHTKKNKNPKNPKIACDKQEMSYFYAVIMSQQKEQILKSAFIFNLTSGKCHTVKLSHCHTKNTKNAKNEKIVQLLYEKIFMQPVTLHCSLCDTELCDIFDGHLKDGQRHGMDTYLLFQLLSIPKYWLQVTTFYMLAEEAIGLI